MIKTIPSIIKTALVVSLLSLMVYFLTDSLDVAISIFAAIIAYYTGGAIMTYRINKNIK